MAPISYRTADDHLGRTLDSCAPEGRGKALDALLLACRSDAFKTLGIPVPAGTRNETVREKRAKLYLAASLLLVVRGTSKEHMANGLQLAEESRHQGPWPYGTSVKMSWDFKRKIREEIVRGDHPDLVRRCADIFRDDLHMYFMDACEQGSPRIFADLAPRQAKRYSSQVLLMAVSGQNKNLVDRLLPYCAPTKDNSKVLDIAAQRIAELEGLGSPNQRLRNMTDQERRDSMERAMAILETLAGTCDAVQALMRHKWTKPNPWTVRVGELLLFHATPRQWQRAARNQARRQALPALAAWHARQQLVAQAQKEAPKRQGTRRVM